MAVVAEPVTIRFTDDRRPEAATLVHLETFDGPLGLLLALIEQRQLDILTVRLGELAGAYLEALAAVPGERMPHLSAFVAVAAQLILIKSRAHAAGGVAAPADRRGRSRPRSSSYAGA